MRWKHAYSPSRGGCRRLAEVVCLGLPPPSPDRQSDSPGSLGDKLKPSADDHRQPHQLPDDGTQPPIGQRLLHVGGNVLLPVTLYKNNSLWMQTRLSQRWKKQIRAGQAPDHRSLGPGRNPRCEQCSRGSIHRSRTAARKLVKSAIGQSTARKNSVEFRDSEWKTASLLQALSFD